MAVWGSGWRVEVPPPPCHHMTSKCAQATKILCSCCEVYKNVTAASPLQI